MLVYHFRQWSKKQREQQQQDIFDQLSPVENISCNHDVLSESDTKEWKRTSIFSGNAANSVTHLQSRPHNLIFFVSASGAKLSAPIEFMVDIVPNRIYVIPEGLIVSLLFSLEKAILQRYLVTFPGYEITLKIPFYFIFSVHEKLLNKIGRKKKPSWLVF